MSRLSKVGRVIYATGAMRTYKNGDGVGFVWRWWNPLSWVLAPMFLALSVLASGAPDAWRYRHEFGFGMNPFFIEHPERLVWTKRP